MAPGPILRLGDRGEFVRTLQLRTESLGFHVGAIDGVFGPQTLMAVKAFQSSSNLEPTGVVDTRTREKLGLDILGHSSIVPGLSWLNDYRSGGSTASALVQGYDANIRVTQYVQPAKQLAQQFLMDVESGKISHLEGRQLASSQRNELLRLTREKLTPGGRAFSEAIKDEGKTLSELIHKYSRKVLEESPDLLKQYGLKTMDPKSPLFDAAAYERAIEQIGRSEQVSMEIIKASGRTGKAVTLMARVSRGAGPIGTGIGLTMSAYEIKNAPPGQRAYVAGREASGFAGGLVGTVGGGLDGFPAVRSRSSRVRHRRQRRGRGRKRLGRWRPVRGWLQGSDEFGEVRWQAAQARHPARRRGLPRRENDCQAGNGP